MKDFPRVCQRCFKNAAEWFTCPDCGEVFHRSCLLLHTRFHTQSPLGMLQVKVPRAW